MESTRIISAFRAERIFKPNDAESLECNDGSRKITLTSARLLSYKGATS